MNARRPRPCKNPRNVGIVRICKHLVWRAKHISSSVSHEAQFEHALPFVTKAYVCFLTIDPNHEDVRNERILFRPVKVATRTSKWRRTVTTLRA